MLPRHSIHTPTSYIKYPLPLAQVHRVRGEGRDGQHAVRLSHRAHTGGHIAIRHDSRMHMENTVRRRVTMLKSACAKVVCPRVRAGH